MKKCLLDTGPMVALFDASDSYHSQSVEFIKSFDGRIYTSLANLTEALYLLDFSKKAQLGLLEWISRGAVELVPISTVEVTRLITHFSKYADLPMDFADGCLLLLAEKLQTTLIATIDRDFEIYRLPKNQPFEIMIGR